MIEGTKGFLEAINTSVHGIGICGSEVVEEKCTRARSDAHQLCHLLSVNRRFSTAANRNSGMNTDEISP